MNIIGNELRGRSANRESFLRTITELNKLETKLDTLLGNNEKSGERTASPRKRTKKSPSFPKFMDFFKKTKRSHKRSHKNEKSEKSVKEEEVTFTPVRKIKSKSNRSKSNKMLTKVNNFKLFNLS